MLERLIAVEEGLWIVEEETPSIESVVEFDDIFNKAYKKGIDYINKNIPIGEVRNKVIQAFSMYLKGELTGYNNPIRGCAEETAYLILTLEEVKDIL